MEPNDDFGRRLDNFMAMEKGSPTLDMEASYMLLSSMANSPNFADYQNYVVGTVLTTILQRRTIEYMADAIAAVWACGYRAGVELGPVEKPEGKVQ